MHGQVRIADGNMRWEREPDRLGRVRPVAGSSALGLERLEPKPQNLKRPAYVYGYPAAVIEEYTVIVGWAVGSHLPWVVKAERLAQTGDSDALQRHLQPVAARHGLDAFTWGPSWLAAQFTGAYVEYIAGPAVGPPHAKHDPERDAVLLYLYLAGVLLDAQCQAIVARFLALPADPTRQARRIMRAVGASRPPGPPPGRYKRDQERLEEVRNVLSRHISIISS